MDGFINLNKPPGMTSFDCIAKLRKILHTKKIGHAGTLDPDARGVLPIAVGKGTRLLEYVTAITKEYRAEMTIGIQTNTQDSSGEVIKSVSSAHISKNDILNILPAFRGNITQIPPMFSAVKIGGKRLYELARLNIEVERKPRQVTIHSLMLKEFRCGEYPKAIIDVVCSKGTYIRTLIEDMGEKMGSTAHMSLLERVSVGKFKVEDAVTLENIAKAVETNSLSFLLPLGYPLEALGQICVGDVTAKRIMHGNKVSIDSADKITVKSGNKFCVLYNDALIAIATIEDKQIIINKVLQTEGEEK